MIDQSTQCFVCQAELSAGSSVCPACGAVIRSRPSWPEWHGAPNDSGNRPRPQMRPSEPEVDAASEVEPLALDPALVDVRPSRPGQRRSMLSMVVCGVLWLLVGLLYEASDPASGWDIVWYAAGAVTIGLAIWLLISLIQRTRTHGFRRALRWLIS